jgi:hypothetical protein
MSYSLPHTAADPCVPPLLWPFKLELASPGFVCDWRPIRPLVLALRSASLDHILDTSLTDQVALLLEPATFGTSSYRVGKPLAAIAAVAGLTLRQALLCLLAAADLPGRGWDLDLVGEELLPNGECQAQVACPSAEETLR